MIKSLVKEEVNKYINELLDFNRTYSYHPPGMDHNRNFYEMKNKKMGKILEDMSVTPKESKYWAMYYNIFEILEKYIDKIDLVYAYLKKELSGRQLEALEYFYNFIIENKDQLE